MPPLDPGVFARHKSRAEADLRHRLQCDRIRGIERWHQRRLPEPQCRRRWGGGSGVAVWMAAAQALAVAEAGLVVSG